MSLQAVGKQEEAQEILELGIKVAGKSGELHAQEELQSALKELCEDIPQ
jgi:tellurite resistance protein